MIKMLEKFKKFIKGNSTNLHQNLMKYDLYPNQVKRFWKDRAKNQIRFITKKGTVVLKTTSESLEIYEFLKSSNMYLWSINQYINIKLVKETIMYYRTTTIHYYLRVCFKDNSYVEFNDLQIPYLKDLNIKIRSLIN